jgi:rhodanese-related sulfurtransferase
VRRPILEAMLLAALAALVGVTANALRRDRLPLRLPSGYYQVESGSRAILLPAARELFNGKKAIFLDARSNDEFEAGRIQGAFSVPVEEWTFLYDDLAAWIEGVPIVIYASPDQVSRADVLARALASRGHRGQMFVYVGGLEEWSAARMPVEAGPAPSLSPQDEEGERW